MLLIHQTHIIKVGNSKGIRIPKEYLASLGTENVVLEVADTCIIIRPASPQPPPRRQWAAILAKMDTTAPEPELNDWDNTLSDGLEDL
jgi:antitoxin MazE